jgi:hypothetical protein
MNPLKFLDVFRKGKNAAKALDIGEEVASLRDLPEALPKLTKANKVLSLWKNAPKIKWAAPVVGLLGAGAWMSRDNQGYTPGVNQELLDTLSGKSSSAEMAKMLADMRAQETADLEKYYGSDSYASNAKQSLNNYINSLNAYAAAQGPAIRRGYEQIAQQAQDDAAAAAAAGQEIAAGVDRAYGDVASQQAALAAGAGTSAEGTDVGSLTGPSGAMAAAPDVSRAYGQTLADYLGRQGNISRQDLAALAQSYLAQGLGTEAQLQAEAAGLGSRAQYNLNQQLAQYEAERADRLAQARMDINNRYRQAEMEQKALDIQRAQQGALAFAQAPDLWKSIKDDSNKKRFWAENFGVTNESELGEILRLNPELMQLLLGA